MFILATAYPTTPPDIPSTSPPFPSPGLSLKLAVLRTLVGEHLYILRRLLWLRSPCPRLRPVLRFVCATPRCPAAAPSHPPFRRSLHHLSICPIHRRHRNVICVPPPFIRASSEHPLFASIWSSQASSDRPRKSPASPRSCSHPHLYTARIVIAIVAPHLYHNATTPLSSCTTTLDVISLTSTPLHSHLVNAPAALAKTCSGLYHHRRSTSWSSSSSPPLCAYPPLSSAYMLLSYAQHVHVCGSPSEQVVSAVVRLAGGSRSGRRWRTGMGWTGMGLGFC